MLIKASLLEVTEDGKKQDQFFIDTCRVEADPPLDLFVEHLSLPTHLMENRGLVWTETNDGVVVISKQFLFLFCPFYYR